MRKGDRTILIIGGIVALLLLTAKSFAAVLQTFLPAVEGFSPVPVWDVKQWSWGYGTAAGFDKNKKPAGSITREKAWQDALQVINDHYRYLKPLITADLNSHQWAALLSFAYNVGPANADNLVANINRNDTAAVVEQMKRYVYADGRYNQGLMNRRIKETNLYQGNAGAGMFRETMNEPEQIEFISADRITDYSY